jgi:molybdopterin molybdotransferase
MVALEEIATRCDVLITSGGVSMGDFDPVRDVLHAHAEVHFWKIAMKPGKPVMFAHFRGVPIFGLPGNPVSVMVTWEEFVRPALLKMSGRRALQRRAVRARLVHPIRRAVGRTEFLRAQVRWENDGFTAQVQGDQGSGRLSSLMNANALLVVDAETGALEAGDWVSARLIDAPETE